MNEIVAALEPVVGALEELGVRYRVGGLGGPTLMGVLHATPARGKHVFSFEYTRAWLDSDQKHRLDPAFALLQGPQYPSAKGANFGCKGTRPHRSGDEPRNMRSTR